MKLLFSFFLAFILALTNCICQNNIPQLLISQGLPNEIGRIMCSPNGNWLIVGANGLIKVFDFNSGAEIATLKYPYHTFNSFSEVQFSNDSKYFVFGGDKSGIVIFNTENWNISKQINDGSFPLSFSPDGKYVAYCDLFNQHASVSKAGRDFYASNKTLKEYKKKHIKVLETEKWKEVNKIELPNTFIQTLGINNRNEIIFNKSDSQRSTIFYASLLGENDFSTIKGFRQSFPITSLKITPRNKILLQGKNIVQILRADLSVFYTELDSTAIFEDFFFDVDSSGNYAAIGKAFSNQYEIKKIDLRKKDLTIETTVIKGRKFISDNYVAFNFQNEVLLGFVPLRESGGITRTNFSQNDNNIQYIDFKTGEVFKTIFRQSKPIRYLLFTNDTIPKLISSDGIIDDRKIGQNIVSRNRINVWDLENASKQSLIDGEVNSISTNDSVTLLSGFNNICYYTKEDNRIKFLSDDPDGRGYSNIYSATLHPKKNIFAFFGTTSENTINLFDISLNKTYKSIPLDIKSNIYKSGLKFNYDGTLLMFYTVKDVHILKVNNRFQSSHHNSFGNQVIQHNFVAANSDFFYNSLIPFPNTNKIAVYNGDGKVEIWDLNYSDDSKRLSSHDGVSPIAINNNGKYLALNYYDEAIHIYNTDNNKLTTSIPINFQVRSLCISPDSKTLAAGTADGIIKLFSLDKGNELTTLVSLKNNDYLVSTQEGYYKANKSSVSKNIFYKFQNTMYPYDQFDLKFNRPDIVLNKMPYPNKSLADYYSEVCKKRLEIIKVEEVDYSNIPKIQILSQQKRRTSNTNYETILNCEQGSEIKFTQAYINNIPLFEGYGTTGFVDKIIVPLKFGDNKIQVQCINKQGAKSNKETFYVYCDNNPKQKIIIVGIGVSNYQDNKLSVSGTNNDISEFVNTIKTRNNNIDLIQEHLFLNENATKGKVLKIKENLLKSNPNDIVIIYFAGHGVFSNNSYFAALYDSDLSSQLNLISNSLSFVEIISLIDNIPAQNRLLILNTCEAGEKDKNQKLFDQMQLTFNDLRDNRGISILTSTSADRKFYVQENARHTIFGQALIHALNSNSTDQNDDGNFQISEILEETVTLTNSMFEESFESAFEEDYPLPTIRSFNTENDFILIPKR